MGANRLRAGDLAELAPGSALREAPHAIVHRERELQLADAQRLRCAGLVGDAQVARRARQHHVDVEPLRRMHLDAPEQGQIAAPADLRLQPCQQRCHGERLELGDQVEPLALGAPRGLGPAQRRAAGADQAAGCQRGLARREPGIELQRRLQAAGRDPVGVAAARSGPQRDVVGLPGAAAPGGRAPSGASGQFGARAALCGAEQVLGPCRADATGCPRAG